MSSVKSKHLRPQGDIRELAADLAGVDRGRIGRAKLLDPMLRQAAAMASRVGRLSELLRLERAHSTSKEAKKDRGAERKERLRIKRAAFVPISPDLLKS